MRPSDLLTDPLPTTRDEAVRTVASIFSLPGASIWLHPWEYGFTRSEACTVDRLLDCAVFLLGANEAEEIALLCSGAP